MASAVMTPPAAPTLASYELPLPAHGEAAPRPTARAGSASLPESILVRNVLWFCRLRWLVVATFVAFGLMSLFTSLLARLGLRPHPHWPLAVAAALAAANLAFLAHARGLTRAPTAHGAKANLWAQILVDLAVLTVVVHYVGSLETDVAFAYLFHIVLACVFFPRAPSLAITAIACGLYTGCVVLEETGVVGLAGIHADSALRNLIDRTPSAWLGNVGWALLTWAVVSYLTSHLSAMVRERDGELAETNRRLEEAIHERAQHMLRTTHELRAPFSAIHANVQLLLKGYCGPLTEETRDVLRRMAARCERLAAEIKEMLQLANLHSKTQAPLPRAVLDAADVLRWCIAQIQPTADARAIAIEEDVRPAPTEGVEDHLKMLFTNLLANAVSYSERGGRVRVECAPPPSPVHGGRPPASGGQGGGGPQVAIEDHGIGIAREKLPRIFDPYYRTTEAVQHNKESTGLGLAIAREVAEANAIRIRIESAPHVGTRFTLTLPAAERGPRQQAAPPRNCGRGLCPPRGFEDAGHGGPAHTREA